jgi:hypothetical protein
MNRYFYQCGTCLLRFTADAEQDYQQPRTGTCPVCANQHIQCLGATKGVLSYKAPCDDRCTNALGPDCSCACGGKLHGSGLLVPTIGNIVDLSYERIKGIAQTRREYEKYAEELATLPSYAAYRIRNQKTYPARMRMIAQAQTRLGIQPATRITAPTIDVPCLPYGRAKQLTLI